MYFRKLNFDHRLTKSALPSDRGPSSVSNETMCRVMLYCGSNSLRRFIV